MPFSLRSGCFSEEAGTASRTPRPESQRFRWNDRYDEDICIYIYIDTRTQTISYMLRKTVCLFETPSSSRLSSSIAEPMDLQRSSFVKRSTSNAAPDIDRPIDRATHRWSSSRDFVENSWVFGEWTSCQRKMVLDVLLLNLVCHVDGIVWQWVVCFSFLPKVR